MDAGRRLRELCQDRQRGASEITQDAAEMLSQVADQAPQADATERLLEAGRTLIEAHPSMASLVHLVNDALVLVETKGPKALDDLVEEQRRRREQVAEHLARRVKGAAHVVTYSRSGTVLDGLQAVLAEAPLTVTVSEGDPGREGVTVARALHQAGATVHLTTDAALFQALQDAELLVLGADGLDRDGFVNKVGSAALCQVAGAYGVPRVVACTLDKRVPPGYRRPPEDQEVRVPGPSLPRLDRQVALFEMVGYELVDQVITEQGPRSPEELRAGIAEIDLHPALRRALER